MCANYRSPSTYLVSLHRAHACNLISLPLVWQSGLEHRIICFFVDILTWVECLDDLQGFSRGSRGFRLNTKAASLSQFMTHVVMHVVRLEVVVHYNIGAGSSQRFLQPSVQPRSAYPFEYKLEVDRNVIVNIENAQFCPWSG